MAITTGDFDAINERDLIQLIDDKVSEGLTLDYKRDVYDRSDDGKRELLKDVSSFVNTAGGHMVMGMNEGGGVPTDLLGLDLEPDMFFPPVMIDDYADFGNYRRALKPLFDALWNAAGWPGSASYNPDGSWRRRS